MKVLHLNASPRREHSRTLKISNTFLNTLTREKSDVSIKTIDLFETQLPEITDLRAIAKITLTTGGSLDESTRSTWEVIETYSKEFLAHDVYVITAPMWNFSIPYKLKHYIDVIMQAGHLFRYSESGVEGLAKGKKMFFISSSGSDYSPGSPYHQYDFREPYIRAIFGLAGIYDITFINAQPLDYTPEIAKVALDNTIDEARAHAMNGI